MHDKKDLVFFLVVVIAMSVFVGVLINDNRRCEKELKDLRQNVADISAKNFENASEISILQQNNQILEEENEKLAEQLLSTYISTILVDNKKDYQCQMVLHNTEEAASEAAMLLTKDDEYSFFLNYIEDIHVNQVTANGINLPLTQHIGFTSFQYDLAEESDVMFTITYQKEDIIVTKYIKFLVRE